MQQEESAALCSAGCGFFGNPAHHGMCSVCWKKRGAKIPADAPTVVPSSEPVSLPQPQVTATVALDSTTNEAVQDTQEPAKPIQSNKGRCWSCKKKVGLTGIECRCGYVYCGQHRFADQHDCSFDYKAADMAELAKRNPGGGAFNKLDKL
ncbi:hypothetical protein Ae201684P_003188 [Aphanomyces euteiches]|uniref:AN1-type domain-containing protein n=1 Tax=Aphanomyces euteiches TaxID=100861 RepID=A0A6G0X2M6_9STRA|nr:hypothetical protein Ae201684_009021 [Aphanomyces euteiches]KAH9073685.1 hypothetical protein Ae201684P_003188 [Aphanomyces euteiches]KAH9134612.1 hypothetical protein AeRB84_019659 [Aphanomyces euteiches]